MANAPLTVEAMTVAGFRFAPGSDTISVIESTSNVVMRPQPDGRVVRRLASVWKRVKAGRPSLVLDDVRQGQAITGIVNNSTLWILMDRPAWVAGPVMEALPVQLESQGNPAVKGLGRPVFQNLTGVLKPGQFVCNRSISRVSDQLLVPEQAVMMQAQQPFVYWPIARYTILPRITASDQLSAEESVSWRSIPSPHQRSCRRR